MLRCLQRREHDDVELGRAAARGARELKYETDGEGYFELRLGPCAYSLRNVSPDIADYKSASFSWPLAPGDEDITFDTF